MELKKRSEFPENELWDLTALYQDQEDFLRAIEKTREEINEFSQFSTWKDKERVRLGLIGIAYLTQEIKKLSIFDLGWVKQQFQRLKDLNAQYQLGQRCWRNDKDYYCDDDKNSRKAV